MSNIYLNEFDRYVKHELKPFAYLRYGDDWLMFCPDKQTLIELRQKAVTKLAELSLTVNPKLDRIVIAQHSITFLGVNMWPGGRRLTPAVRLRIQKRVKTNNLSSYRALVRAHEKTKYSKIIDWYQLTNRGSDVSS